MIGIYYAARPEEAHQLLAMTSRPADLVRLRLPLAGGHTITREARSHEELPRWIEGVAAVV